MQLWLAKVDERECGEGVLKSNTDTLTKLASGVQSGVGEIHLFHRTSTEPCIRRIGAHRVSALVRG